MRATSRKSGPLLTSLALLVLFIGMMVFGPWLTKAHAPATAITIVNSSSREIRHVYLSAPDQDNWGSDQLVNSVIPPNGGTFTISDANCGGAGVKVIAEDQEGCFVYKVVACSASVTWTITSDDSRDCGN